jgi:hypothetical protein
MITFIREKFIFFLSSILLVILVTIGLFFIDEKEGGEYSDKEYPCAEYQDSIYLLNYKVSQLELKVGSLLLKLEEVEEANPGILKDLETNDFQ